MHVHQAVMNGMLKGITDPKLRETYGNILSGRYAYKVYCMSPKLDPAKKTPRHAVKCLIGYVTPQGQVMDMQTLNKAREPIAGIETSRDRFDGRKGFRCYCGNWSIQCPEEIGVLEQSKAPMPPTKEQLEEIFMRVQNSKKGQLQFFNGIAEYDGFMLEEVTT